MTMTTEQLRIVLVEDHSLLAESMLVVLSAEGFSATSVPVPAQATDPDVLSDRILSEQPDVVLLDLDLGAAGDGTTLVEPLRRSGSAVVVMTGSTDRSRWGHCLARGAHTVLPKSTGVHEIMQIVRRIAAGRPVIDPAMRAQLIAHWHQQHSRRQSKGEHLDRLTRRENQVLAGLADGKRVRDIARESYVSEATVRTQVKSILAKLGVNSQIAAVAVARDAGWVPPSAPGS